MTVRSVLAIAAAVVMAAGCTSGSVAKAGGTSYLAVPLSAQPTLSGSRSSFVMPNEVGAGLQAAQDDVQKVSGNPIFISHSTDAKGAGRHQILDRDWKVCSQNPAAGTTVAASGYVTFGAVKLDETCP